MCVGPPGVCPARTCDPAPGARYCGKVGDDCGHALDCGDRCAALAPGWVCDPSKNACVGGPDCQRAQCTTANGGRYCGTVGDGCGGVLACGDDYSSAGPGWICDPAQGICTGGPSCQRISCTTPEGGQYCGDIGDGCGGTLKCPAACPGSGTCVNHVCPSSSCDPAGKVPIYNVIVYVPDAPLEPIAKGAAYQSCSASISGRRIATALTADASSLQVDRAGEPAGSYLRLAFTSTSRVHENPIVRLRAQFDAWRMTHPCAGSSDGGGGGADSFAGQACSCALGPTQLAGSGGKRGRSRAAERFGVESVRSKHQSDAAANSGHWLHEATPLLATPQPLGHVVTVGLPATQVTT